MPDTSVSALTNSGNFNVSYTGYSGFPWPFGGFLTAAQHRFGRNDVTLRRIQPPQCRIVSPTRGSARRAVAGAGAGRSGWGYGRLAADSAHPGHFAGVGEGGVVGTPAAQFHDSGSTSSRPPKNPVSCSEAARMVGVGGVLVVVPDALGEGLAGVHAVAEGEDELPDDMTLISCLMTDCGWSESGDLDDDARRSGWRQAQVEVYKHVLVGRLGQDLVGLAQVGMRMP